MEQITARAFTTILRHSKQIADLLRCAVPSETLENFDHAAGITDSKVGNGPAIPCNLENTVGVRSSA